MKKLLITIIASLMFMFTGLANASVLGAFGVHAAVITLPYYMAKNEKPKYACETDKQRLVAWKSNPNGYSFVVSGCDYKAKKHLYIEK